MKMKADELITQRLAETSTLSPYAKKGDYKGTIDRSRVNHPEASPFDVRVRDMERRKPRVTDTGKGTIDRSKRSIKKESY